MEIGYITCFFALVVLAYPFSRILAKGKLSLLSRSTTDAGDVIAREEDEGVGDDGSGAAEGININSNRFSKQSATISNESEKQDQPNTNDYENTRNGRWKCVCEGGGLGLFLPPSMMKSMGGPGAAIRLGTGGCFHKQS